MKESARYFQNRKFKEAILFENERTLKISNDEFVKHETDESSAPFLKKSIWTDTFIEQ